MKQSLSAMILESRSRAAMKSLQPVDADDPLWRYMDVSKFLALLASSQLPLIRVDKLGDQYEGFVAALPKQDYAGRILGKKELEHDCEVRKNAKRARTHFYASCWHGNEEESDAMWKLYLKGDGLAIQTTCGGTTAARLSARPYQPGLQENGIA
jgi:hypothetical protein